ncbi:MAG: 16S rRNA (adenine(1518)-N(6)/adenine(1519)-N(6))-dimethyltransferase RsmA [bacterium]|nr:16S rRNA (adenine(1518)-N(6)/adenine(1519)-N(6))-dimethyltransferase RsmA [bacterium]
MGSPMGQHFLRDESVLEEIAQAAEITKNDLVIEVGGGKGQLTKHLITRAKKVLCVELDEDLVRVLSFTKHDNLEIISGNILELDLPSLIKKNGFEKAIVIGNIPYYLTSPLVVKLLENIRYFTHIVFLIQREVAERLGAKPGTKDYGSLSIFTQFYTDVEIVGFVGREKFKPPPKVESAIVKLSVREKPLIAMDDEETFFSFVRKSFQFRRKKAAKVIAGHLEKEKEDVEKVFGSLNLDTNLRAEDLSAGDFYNLYKELVLKK